MPSNALTRPLSIAVILASGAGFASVAAGASVAPPSVVYGSNVPDAGEALGPPDGQTGLFGDGNPNTTQQATYGSFNDSYEYDSADLMVLLLLSQMELLNGNILAFAQNQEGFVGPSSSTWLFASGDSSFAVDFVHDEEPPPGVVATGEIDAFDYHIFFDLFNEPGNDDYNFMVFDIPEVSGVDPYAADFTITVSAVGSVASNSPNIDAMGVVTIPGPGALALLGLAGLARRRRR